MSPFVFILDFGELTKIAHLSKTVAPMAKY